MSLRDLMTPARPAEVRGQVDQARNFFANIRGGVPAGGVDGLVQPAAAAPLGNAAVPTGLGAPVGMQPQANLGAAVADAAVAAPGPVLMEGVPANVQLEPHVIMVNEQPAIVQVVRQPPVVQQVYAEAGAGGAIAGAVPEAGVKPTLLQRLRGSVNVDRLQANVGQARGAVGGLVVPQAAAQGAAVLQPAIVPAGIADAAAPAVAGEKWGDRMLRGFGMTPPGGAHVAAPAGEAGGGLGALLGRARGAAPRVAAAQAPIAEAMIEAAPKVRIGDQLLGSLRVAGKALHGGIAADAIAVERAAPKGLAELAQLAKNLRIKP